MWYVRRTDTNFTIHFHSPVFFFFFFFEALVMRWKWIRCACKAPSLAAVSSEQSHWLVRIRGSSHRATYLRLFMIYLLYSSQIKSKRSIPNQWAPWGGTVILERAWYANSLRTKNAIMKTEAAILWSVNNTSTCTWQYSDSKRNPGAYKNTRGPRPRRKIWKWTFPTAISVLGRTHAKFIST